jgi:hypothetical protein
MEVATVAIAGEAPTAVPHVPQNRASGEPPLPHAGQVLPSRAPQPSQKRCPPGFPCPHAVQAVVMTRRVHTAAAAVIHSGPGSYHPG